MRNLAAVDFTKFKTASEAAQAAHRAIKQDCVEYGMDPNFEVSIKTPKESPNFAPGEPVWWVCWESGPASWAVAQFINGPWGFCETHWGFDLIFNEE